MLNLSFIFKGVFTIQVDREKQAQELNEQSQSVRTDQQSKWKLYKFKIHLLACRWIAHCIYEIDCSFL